MMKQKLLLLSAFLGLVGARAATIVVNGVSGNHIVTMENVDPAQMTVHDLRERVVSAKGGPAEGPFLQANLSLISDTVKFGPEEYQGERGQDQPLGKTRTLAEAFNLPRRRLSGKQAAGRLWHVPDRLLLTAVFHDVAQRVRDACAAATEPRENEMWSLVENVKRFRAAGTDTWGGVRAEVNYFVPLTIALQTVADVLGLQLADREKELERNGQRPEFEKNDQGEPVLYYYRHPDDHWKDRKQLERADLSPVEAAELDRIAQMTSPGAVWKLPGEADWKKRAVAWRQGLRGGNVVGQDSLPLMPGAFRWNWHILTVSQDKCNQLWCSPGRLRSGVNGLRMMRIRLAIESVSVEGAPQWVQEALDTCWVAAAETSGIREAARPIHYAERRWYS